MGAPRLLWSPQAWAFPCRHRGHRFGAPRPTLKAIPKEIHHSVGDRCCSRDARLLSRLCARGTAAVAKGVSSPLSRRPQAFEGGARRSPRALRQGRGMRAALLVNSISTPAPPGTFRARGAKHTSRTVVGTVPERMPGMVPGTPLSLLPAAVVLNRATGPNPTFGGPCGRRPRADRDRSRSSPPRPPRRK